MSRRRKRREKGTGTIRPRKDGDWEWRPPPNTSLKPAYYFKSEGAAIMGAKDLLKLRSSGDRLSSVIEIYLREYKDTVQERTYEGVVDLTKHLAPLGKKKIDKIQQHEVENLLRDVGERVSMDMRKRVLRITKAIFSDAVRRRYIDFNPVEHIKHPRTKRKVGSYDESDKYKTKRHTREEMRAIFKAFETSRWSWMVKLWFATGLRPGEIAALKPEAIDFEQGVLKIRATLSKKGKLKETKTTRSDRDVSFGSVVEGILKDWLESEDFTSTYKKGGTLFPGIKGGPLNMDNWRSRVWYTTLRAAGVRLLPPHTNRHSHGTHLLDEDMNPANIAERLGHKDMKSLFGTYGHATSRGRIQGADHSDDLLEDTLGGGDPNKHRARLCENATWSKSSFGWVLSHKDETELGVVHDQADWICTPGNDVHGQCRTVDQAKQCVEICANDYLGKGEWRR